MARTVTLTTLLYLGPTGQWLHLYSVRAQKGCFTRILDSAHKNGPVLDWTATCKAICLGSTIARRSEEGTAAMEAGGVYHLLAQARHLEEIQPVREDPKSVELRRLGRLGDPNTEDGTLELNGRTHHLCWHLNKATCHRSAIH